ncbi:MAG: hypothetical protein JWO31_3138, partial [Phycisphaerales bacterium]|nr:hypothetical protein [Phycisphaerales bacterium]
LTLNDVLPSAMRAIESKTGVPVRADPAVWDLLPWGDRTNVAATIRNQTLRQALAAITPKLGLAFEVANDGVVLRPVPALARIGRRATPPELTALDRLAAEAMPPVAGAGNVRAVLTAVDQRLDALKAGLAVEDRLDPDTRGKVVSVPRNATLLDALEQIGRQTRATWYPSGRTIVIVAKEDYVREQLGKSVSNRYAGAELGQVLEDLRRTAGVPFEVEPGAIQRVPAEFRTIRAVWDNVTVRQALEALKGFAGIDYVVTDAGVRITNPAPAIAAAPIDPVLAMVQLDNGMTVFVRESQVPPELRAYLQHRMAKSVDALREMAKAEHFAFAPPPATRPATAPGQ